MKWLGAVTVLVCIACSSPVIVDNKPQWSFPSSGNAQPIDKVDLLFAIDNSSSMADKQDLLAAAMPAFIGRLLNPNCIDDVTSASVPGDQSNCATLPHTHPEFPAVHDLHIGIVSSSLGDATPDGTTCVQDVLDSTHQNDKAHLLNRTSSGAIANAKPAAGDGGNFLAWLPTSSFANTGKPAPNVTPYTQDTQGAQFVADFQALVTGVGETGCGLEAQLESWYRFLIQPDPYDTITFTGDVPPKAELDGTDSSLLKIRQDFLRPDSLVAIIQITDEEDSWSDPLWLGGYGWTSRTPKTNLVGGPGGGIGPRGTSECDTIDVNQPTTTGPNDPDCTSCEFPSSQKPVSGATIGDDPNCIAQSWYTATTDGLNVRYASQLMRPRYGYDNQPDVHRYIDGLTLPTVPDAAHESHSAPYSSTIRNCTNPLFAEALPDGSDTTSVALCNLRTGPRTPDMIYYALIGGVPNDLLGNWTAMLGKDPAHYIFDGIDPRMIQSITPRAGVSGDWNTLTSSQGIDLEYACTFALPSPRDCSVGNDPSCECHGVTGGPPLCDPQNPTMQILGKAYPTTRELRVAQGLGTRGVVGSICAIDATGYASTATHIIDTLGGSLAECAQTLQQGCEVLVELPTNAIQATACSAPGLSQPSGDVLAAFTAANPNAVACVLAPKTCPPAGTQTILACSTAF